MLLSIFGDDSTLGGSPDAWLVTCFARAMARALEMRNKVLAYDTTRRRAVGLFVDCRTESTLRSQMANKCSMSVASVRALLSAATNSSALVKLWPAPLGGLAAKARDIPQAQTERFAVSHPGELAVIKRKPKGISESRERSLGGVGFGGFEGEFMRLARG